MAPSARGRPRGAQDRQPRQKRLRREEALGGGARATETDGDATAAARTSGDANADDTPKSDPVDRGVEWLNTRQSNALKWRAVSPASLANQAENKIFVDDLDIEQLHVRVRSGAEADICINSCERQHDRLCQVIRNLREVQAQLSAALDKERREHPHAWEQLVAQAPAAVDEHLREIDAALFAWPPTRFENRDVVAARVNSAARDLQDATDKAVEAVAEEAQKRGRSPIRQSPKGSKGTQGSQGSEGSPKELGLGRLPIGMATPGSVVPGRGGGDVLKDWFSANGETDGDREFLRDVGSRISAADLPFHLPGYVEHEPAAGRALRLFAPDVSTVPEFVPEDCGALAQLADGFAAWLARWGEEASKYLKEERPG